MDKLKFLIKTWMEKDFSNFHNREFNYSLIDNKKIISFVGVRRSGKTTYLFQIMKYLLEKGAKRENLIYINFEDDRLYPLDGTELDNILPTIEEIVNYDKNNVLYLFLDEIQNLNNWSKWLRRIQDTKENIKIFVTGSSAKLLSKEIATELSGRTISLEIFPFSFKEVLESKNIEYDNNIYFSDSKAIILKEFDNYLHNGGFPEIIYEKENKNLILQSYFDSIFYKDLVQRYNIKSVKMFEDFLKLLIGNTSSIISLSKLENTLKSIGHKVSKSTLSEYLNYINEVYFLFSLQVFSYKIKDRLVYPKKIYSIDNGLINSISIKFNQNLGPLLENIVFLELRRKQKEVFYFISKNNLEVDFLIKENLKFTKLIQVSLSLNDEKTRKREFKALFTAMDELKLDSGEIITLDEKDEIEIDGKKIFIIPIYEFLLR